MFSREFGGAGGGKGGGVQGEESGAGPAPLTLGRFSLFVCEGDFRLFKMDSSGCRGNSVTVAISAMETLFMA